MGIVYRAEDRVTGEPVALKLLHGRGHDRRFAHEAHLLSQLAHPAIVRYVAHGVTADARPYLAMEWLEGELLSHRLLGGRLECADTVVLARRLAEGLAAAHASGVVHRDLKPSNIVVTNGDLACAKLIDFGLARRRLDARMTDAGVLIGTFAFMSPEQALASRDLDERSDLFSLGAVLYTCLAGRRPFRAQQASALLAKVVLEDPIRVSELQPEVPPELESLVHGLLAKAPEERPTSAEVAALLVRSGSPRPIVPRALSTTEQRVAWVIVIGRVSDLPTVEIDSDGRQPDPARTLAGVAREWGGRFDLLMSGAGVVTFPGTKLPTDLAPDVARVALALRAKVPNLPMALALGLGVVSDHAPVGPAIDSAALGLASASPGEIRLDAQTARLLGHRFEIRADAGLLSLVGESRRTDKTRKLLGRPTRCVGRDPEIEMLLANYDACVDGPAARAVLVTGPAGCGKSRLRYEVVTRLRQSQNPPSILLARGDAMSAGSAFGLASQLLRGRFGIADGEPEERSQDKLVANVSKMFPVEQAVRVGCFLGELMRLPHPVSALTALASLRRDPTAIGDAMRDAWLDFLAVEARERAVVLVLEDLHWGDLPSVRLVDAALGTLAESPLLVIALARPEVHDAFVELWRNRECEEVRIPPLSPRAARELAREVLGSDATDETVSRCRGAGGRQRVLSRGIDSPSG